MWGASYFAVLRKPRTTPGTSRFPPRVQGSLGPLEFGSQGGSVSDSLGTGVSKPSLAESSLTTESKIREY